MRVRSLAVSVGVVLAGSSAFADGRVFRGPPASPPVQIVSDYLSRVSQSGQYDVALDPVIPDQRALIVHKDGRETLVIETAFEGRGTEFAWVVPTPTVPKIEEASTELFPRLAAATRPELVSRVPDLGIAGLVLTGGLLLARHGGRRGGRAAKAFVVGAVAFALLSHGAYDLHRGDSRSVLTSGAPIDAGLHVPMTPAEEPVVVRQREVVGAFETVTLSARDPHALADWLERHGYAVPSGVEEVAADYVRDGWVFNAMRLHRDGDRSEAVRIRPLAFTFDAPTAVYPMRLTGVTESPVHVELFVAGARRAEADGFVVPRCAHVSTDWTRYGDSGHVDLANSTVAGLVRGTSVLTKLDRTFTPAQMKADVPIRFTDYAQTQRTVFSEKAATALAWNAGAVIAIAAFVGLASAGGGATGRRHPGVVRRWTATALVLFIALDAGLAVAAFAPTVKTRPQWAVERDLKR